MKTILTIMHVINGVEEVIKELDTKGLKYRVMATTSDRIVFDIDGDFDMSSHPFWLLKVEKETSVGEIAEISSDEDGNIDAGVAEDNVTIEKGSKPVVFEDVEKKHKGRYPFGDRLKKNALDEASDIVDTADHRISGLIDE